MKFLKWVTIVIGVAAQVPALASENTVWIKVDAKSGRATCYYNGRKTWTTSVRCEGLAGRWPSAEPDWKTRHGDTPPGVYSVTRVEAINPPESPFGPVYIWLEPKSGPCTLVTRSGIGWHGGGSGLPNPVSPRQGWARTLGCIRSQNLDLTMTVAPSITDALRRGIFVKVEVCW